MKLCFVTYQFKTGGVERVFCALAKQLTNDMIFLLPVTPFRDEMIRNIPKNVVFIDLYKKGIFKILGMLMQRYAILSGCCRVFSLLFAVIYVRFSRLFKDTTFINFSDTISSMILSYYGSHNSKVFSWLHFNPKTIKNSRFEFIYYFIYRKFYKIVCICEEQRELMSKSVPGIDKGKLVVIYNILDYHLINELSKEKGTIKDEYIVMVARFDYRSKDFATIIDAYSNLPIDLKSRYKLVFVGDGPDINDVKESISNNKDKQNIIFVGMQNNPFKWIRNATILVHSSKTEGLPTVLLEALACHTPVISTNCETGPTEILDYGNAGILVDVGNQKQMSYSIKCLLENEALRNELIKNGDIQLKKFSTYEILLKFNKLWND